MWIGAGVIGGIGLGLGYISPVSTLIKLVPDRRGMATGMAIMGFGGGAMIGSPLATILMNELQRRRLFGRWIHAALGRLPHGNRRRRLGDLRRPRRHLLRVHDGRRVRLSPAAGAVW